MNFTVWHLMSLLFFPASLAYFVPTGIAAYRDHRDQRAIVLINIFLGWTVVGWVVTLIWACSGESIPRQIGTTGDGVKPGGLRLEGRDPRFDQE